MKKVKIGLLLAAFCVASVFAQGISVTAPKVTVTAPAVATPEAPAVPAPAAPTAPAVAVPDVPAVPAEPAPAVPALAEPVAADSATAIDSVKIAEAAPEPPKVEIPPAPEPAPKAEPQPAPAALPPVVAKEPLNIKFHLGTRLGLGISALRNHKALRIYDYTYNDAIRLGPAFSLGGGLAFAIEINDIFTLAPELQYTWYRANGEFAIKNGGSFPDLNEAGASLHSFELPILARFNFSYILYVEVGPQVGYNYYAKIYRNSEYQKPEIKNFAFGPSLGFGLNAGETLIGLRGHFGLFEYAKNTKGYPWAAQVSVTQFFF